MSISHRYVARIGGVILLVAMLTMSPANASTYSVDFDVGAVTVTGTLVTDTDSGVLADSDFGSWSFTVADTESTSSYTFSGSGATGSGSSPLSVVSGVIGYHSTAIGSVTFNAGSSGGLTFGDDEITFFDFALTGFNLPDASSSYAVEIDTIQIATVTPLPAALPLFATGLGALGLLGWRRKRKNAASLAAA